MKHLDLFSGIGGFALAAKWVWGEYHHIHSFVEIEPFCQKVLKKHWPDVPIHSDIKDYKHDGTTIDLLTGGFPCQPFSQAGKQRGKGDDRYLWPEMLRIIQECNPNWVIGENVAGIYDLGLEKAVSDLENQGYFVEVFNIPACAVDAPHERQRFWIIGHSDSLRFSQSAWDSSKQYINIFCKDFWSWEKEKWGFIDDKSQSKQKYSKSMLCRIDDGISDRVDRLRSLGNAIVPQVVVPIMQAIKQIEESKPN